MNIDNSRGELINIARSFCEGEDLVISRDDIPKMIDSMITGVKKLNISNIGKRYQLWNTTEQTIIYETDSHDEVFKRLELVLPNKRFTFLIVDIGENKVSRISIDDSIKILDSFMDEEMTFDSEEEKINFKLDIVNKYKQKAKTYVG